MFGMGHNLMPSGLAPANLQLDTVATPLLPMHSTTRSSILFTEAFGRAACICPMAYEEMYYLPKTVEGDFDR
jgi:hypothetical protein